MRICLYTNTALPKIGGQEIVVDALARQFLALGHEPVVLAPWRSSQGPFDAASVPYPVAWHPRFISTCRFVSWYGYWMSKLHHIRRFDVVHCHGTYPAAYVAASCKAVRQSPLIITSHGDDLAPHGLYDRKPKLRALFRSALARADAAVAISGFTAGLFRKTCPEMRRIVDIPNGVNVLRFATAAPRPADLDRTIQPKRYLLFLGRLDARKGVDVLLNALAVAGSECSLDLVVAGTGPESTALASLACRLGLASRIHFLGQADGDRKTWLLQNGLCTILSSRIWEALPLVTLESYAAGRPVIATNVPGLREQVQHEQTGLLVPSEDPRSLAEAIVRVISHRQQADVWGGKAQRFAQQFNWNGIALKHLDLFGELIQTRRRGAAAPHFLTPVTWLPAAFRSRSSRRT